MGEGFTGHFRPENDKHFRDLSHGDVSFCVFKCFVLEIPAVETSEHNNSV